MNNFFRFLVVTMLFLSGIFSCFAQSKKAIRKNNIKGITEVVTEYEAGKESTHNDVAKKFDRDGEVIQEINYDKNGILKEKILTKNNKDGDKIEETFFGADGKQSRRFAYKYDSFGEKIEEIQYDAKNELFTKSVYVNNNKGLKAEKKTYDAKGKLIQVKKYIYE